MHYRILFLVFFLYNWVFSQNITCLYEVKARLNTKKPDSLAKEYYFLDIEGKQSVYRSEYQKKSDSMVYEKRYAMGRKPLFMTELFSLKNLETLEVNKLFTTLMGTRFHIPIKEPMVWKVDSETQKFGDLDCQKAELDYGGRHWIAWFAKSVNLQEGPYVFYGLPGLIVKINDTNEDYQFNLVYLKTAKTNHLYPPKLGNKIGWGDFQKMQKIYYEDPLYEVKSSGIKYATGDDQGNVIRVNPKKFLEKHQLMLRNNANNPLELDKAVIFK